MIRSLFHRCRKLPKGMRDWPAYLELKKKIDDFSETCPLLELMANKVLFYLQSSDFSGIS